MGHAAGKCADRLHFLRLAQLLFHVPVLRYVALDAPGADNLIVLQNSHQIVQHPLFFPLLVALAALGIAELIGIADEGLHAAKIAGISGIEKIGETGIQHVVLAGRAIHARQLLIALSQTAVLEQQVYLFLVRQRGGNRLGASHAPNALSALLHKGMVTGLTLLAAGFGALQGLKHLIERLRHAGELVVAGDRNASIQFTLGANGRKFFSQRNQPREHQLFKQAQGKQDEDNAHDDQTQGEIEQSGLTTLNNVARRLYPKRQNRLAVNVGQ